MHKTTKVIGKWSLSFLLIGLFLVGVVFILIEFQVHDIDYFLGWLSVPIFLISIALFIGFLVSFIYTSVRKPK